MIELLPIPFCLMASYTDIKYQKIRNWTTYPLFGIGLVLKIMNHGVCGIGEVFMLVFYMCMLFTVAKTRYGGGDVKLILATGVFLPWDWALRYLVAVVTAVLLGGMAAYARRHSLPTLVTVLKTDLLTCGTAPNESIRIVAGPIITAAYAATALLLLFSERGAIW